jgi:hypothetical protein
VAKQTVPREELRRSSRLAKRPVEFLGLPERLPRKQKTTKKASEDIFPEFPPNEAEYGKTVVVEESTDKKDEHPVQRSFGASNGGKQNQVDNKSQKTAKLNDFTDQVLQTMFGLMQESILNVNND